MDHVTKMQTVLILQALIFVLVEMDTLGMEIIAQVCSERIFHV